MNVKLPKEQEVIQEALKILSKQMEASKVVVLASMLSMDGGDYMSIRKQLFVGETVSTLAQKILNYQHQKEKRISVNDL